METIRSPKNQTVCRFLENATFAGRQNAGTALAYGYDSIKWALSAGCEIICIAVNEKNTASDSDAELLRGNRVYRLSECLFRKITGVSHDQGACALLKIPNRGDIFAKKENLIVMDRVLDHGNIGTIIRTMRCFGFESLIMTNTMDPYYRNIVSASRGEAFKIRFKCLGVGELIESLGSYGYNIIATSPRGTCDINKVGALREPFALVFGNEESGISHELLSGADLILGCPLQNNIDSLNVGVAAGIIMYGVYQSTRGARINGY